VAKRLCTDHKVAVAEIHSYHQVGDELRFVPVYRAPADVRGARSAAPAAAAPRKPRPARRPPKPAVRQAQARPAPRRGTRPKPAKKVLRTKRR
jgi:hypothetical protein